MGFQIKFNWNSKMLHKNKSIQYKKRCRMSGNQVSNYLWAAFFSMHRINNFEVCDTLNRCIRHETNMMLSILDTRFKIIHSSFLKFIPIQLNREGIFQEFYSKIHHNLRRKCLSEIRSENTLASIQHPLVTTDDHIVLKFSTALQQYFTPSASSSPPQYDNDYNYCPL